jgi:hypothetical protein
MFANVSTSLDGDFTLKAILLTVLVLQIVSLVRGILRGSERRDVTILEQFATKTDLRELSAEVEANRKASEVSRARIYEQIERTRKELDSKVDNMPDRLVVLLRNTGAIK